MKKKVKCYLCGKRLARYKCTCDFIFCDKCGSQNECPQDMHEEHIVEKIK